MKKYHINENELIKHIFDNKKNIDNINEVIDIGNMASDIKDVLNKGFQGIKEPAINIGKIVGREFASAPLVRSYANVVRKNLNRSDEAKRENFAIIKEMFKESIYCLRFFSKSNYSKYLFLVKNYYSWEIAVAIINLYQVKEENIDLAKGFEKINSLSPEDYKDMVKDFYDRVKNGNIYLDKKNIVEKGRSSRRSSSPSQQNQNDISANDISNVFSFLINPSFGLSKIDRGFTGSYDVNFLKLFEKAQNLNQISNKTKKALIDIVDTIQDTKNKFISISNTQSKNDIQNEMKDNFINFPRNEMADDTGKKITYNTLSRKFKIENNFNFSTAIDTVTLANTNPLLLRLRFMFLFVKVFAKTSEAEYLITEIIKKISFIKG